MYKRLLNISLIICNMVFQSHEIQTLCNCKEKHYIHKKLKAFTYNKTINCRERFKQDVLKNERIRFTKHCEKISKIQKGNFIILVRAVSKFKSQNKEFEHFTNAAIRNILFEYYKDVLNITKIKHRFYCDKPRLEAIDFSIGSKLFSDKTVYERDIRCPYNIVNSLINGCR